MTIDAETRNDDSFKRLGLRYNPFPPATTGVAFVEKADVPESWEIVLRDHVQSLSTGIGDKALAIVGGYGSGKTYLLHWIAKNLLPILRVQPFFFDNPGLAFYDLANSLLRQVGRYEFSKALWEMLYRPGEEGIQPALIKSQYPDWLAGLRDREARNTAMGGIQRAIISDDITTDEEVAHRFARLIVETRERPYYEYRDFVPRSPSTLVAENQEALYFQTLIRLLISVLSTKGVAFLIDEFEDVALGRRLNRKQVADYIATIRRLLNTAQEEEFWLILSMTPQGFDQTNRIEPSLMERFSHKFEIPLLSEAEAEEVIVRRLLEARLEPTDGLYPFLDDVISVLRPTTRSSPRRLIKVFWQTLALAIVAEATPPISNETVQRAEKLVYPEGIE